MSKLAAHALQADVCVAFAAMPEIEAARLVADGVALQPTAIGWNWIAKHGKTAVVSDLQRRLAAMDLQSTPALWRFVTDLPGVRPCGPMHPSWICLLASDTAWQGETVVGGDLAVLQGHFPKEPIVPGVAQLFWAAALARRVFPRCAAGPRGLSRLTGEVRGLKFKRVILPGTQLRVSLTLKEGDPPHVAFEYQSDRVHSLGRLLLTPS